MLTERQRYYRNVYVAYCLGTGETIPQRPTLLFISDIATAFINAQIITDKEFNQFVNSFIS